MSRYQIMVNGVVEDTINRTSYTLHTVPNRYEVAVRSKNSEGFSTAELKSVTHTIQNMTPPKGEAVTAASESVSYFLDIFFNIFGQM